MEYRCDRGPQRILPLCQEKAKQREEEIRLRSEGPRRLQYILTVIRRALGDIDYYERKKAEFELLEQKKREKGEEAVPDYWIQKEKLRVSEYDAAVAKSTIEKERVELGKLLSHENEVIRNGARQEYLEYVNKMKKIREKFKKSTNNKNKHKEIEIVTPS